MQTFVDLAVDKIVEEYDPHTIILYGSRARGDFTELSDVDIACFCEDKSELKIATLMNGIYLDLWVYPTSSMNNLSPETLRFSSGILKLDKFGFGGDYLQRIKEFEAKGPEKISTSELEHSKAWLNKMMSRVQSNDIEGNYRRIWLQFELLEIYFKFRGLWFSGSKRSFQYLKENDSLGYNLFEKTYQEPENFAHLFELVRYVTKV